MKTLIIGTGNKTTDRLWELVNARTGVSMEDYFERRNLIYGNREKAREAADQIVLEVFGTDRTILLLGDFVRQAFNLRPMLIHPVKMVGCTWRQIPYPSVYNKWYNEPANVALVELLMEDLYKGARQCV
jgi:hypothetical protein